MTTLFRNADGQGLLGRAVLKTAFFLGSWLPGTAAWAQDAETREALQHYAQEKRLVWENTERLTLFTGAGGSLRAQSAYTLDQLVIDGQQAQALSKDEIYQDSLRVLRSLEAETWIPKGNGFRRKAATDTLTTGVAHSGVFVHDGRQTHIVFPEVVAGARTRLSYTIEHQDAHFLRPFYFETGYGVRLARMEIVVPANVEIGYSLRGPYAEKVTYRVEKERHHTVHIWEVRDLPRRTFYSDAPGAPFILTHLVPFVKSVYSHTEKRAVPYLGTPASLYGFHSGLLQQLQRVPSDSIRTLALRLAPTPGSLQGAGAILQWVRQHIRYVAFESGMGGFIPREATDVFRKRYGDCKDMSNLLVMLLGAAGYEATHGWTGTTDLPYRCEEVGSPVAFNHMVAMVKLEGKWQIADGTDFSTPLGTPPYALQGKQILLGTPAGGYQVIAVAPVPAASNTVQDSMQLSLEGTRLLGKIQRQYKGLTAYRLLNEWHYVSGQKEEEDFTRRLLSRGSNKLRLTASRFQPTPTEANRQLTASADLELQDYARQVGKEYFINLNLLRKYEDEITPAERRDPIQYKNTVTENQVVVLQIPAGYGVSYLPQAVEGGVAGLWHYRISYEQVAGKVILHKEFVQDALEIESSSFNAQNALVKELRQAYQESVVLTALTQTKN